ncbi:hypothetical protein EH240_36595 [Mesorhizobium tamadayense]|uniref:Uncharacterized protein n=1 Tax=Mesorhizobium tamadayense TaxID=425306 RepID=A0A3P3EKN1_9HYPH|nr:hypothetical protein [Mesorhizobium tamadayense]RRH86910.1 hypothetical protein EH240_36595 [Mesorhizobium tamadayense]
MNPNNDTEPVRNAIALGAWENEGGAPGRDSMDHQYGRRIETDRSWTVYHVFTGVPAQADGQIMTGLSRSAATDGMVSLNRRERRHRDQGSLMARVQLARCSVEECRR